MLISGNLYAEVLIMRNIRFVSVFVVVLFLAGCFGGASAPSDGPDPNFGDETGTVILSATVPANEPLQTLSLATKKEVDGPTQVRFRIANDEYDYNLLRNAIIDTSGVATLGLSIPAARGFDVSAASFFITKGHEHTGFIATAESTSNVLIQSDSVTEVSLEPSPFSYTFTAPETARAGEKVTITFEIKNSPIDFHSHVFLDLGTEPFDIEGWRGSLVDAPLERDGDDYSATWSFHAPDSPDGETKLYYRVRVDADRDKWLSPS